MSFFGIVAQVSKPAVPPISKSAGRASADDREIRGRPGSLRYIEV